MLIILLDYAAVLMAKALHFVTHQGDTLSRQGLDTIVFTMQKLILNMLNKGTYYKYFKELAVDLDAQCVLLKETHV